MYCRGPHSRFHKRRQRIAAATKKNSAPDLIGTRGGFDCGRLETGIESDISRQDFPGMRVWFKGNDISLFPAFCGHKNAVDAVVGPHVHGRIALPEMGIEPSYLKGVIPINPIL
jgi:hypothetical protein